MRTVTIHARLACDPEMGVTETGVLTADIVLMEDQGRVIKGNWIKDRTVKYELRAWDELARNVGRVLHTGTRVHVEISNLHPHTFKTKDGRTVTVMKGRIEEIGPLLHKFRPRQDRPQATEATEATEATAPTAPTAQAGGDPEAERTGRPVKFDADKPQPTDVVACAKCGESRERRELTKAGNCQKCKRTPKKPAPETASA